MNLGVPWGGGLKRQLCQGLPPLVPAVKETPRHLPHLESGRPGSCGGATVYILLCISHS